MANLWFQALQEALAEGFISQDELFSEIRLGHVHPKVAERVGQKPPWHWRFKSFNPPYKRLQSR